MEAKKEELVTLVVNGSECTVAVQSNETLADVLREKLGLTGLKVGCEAGECGACSVLINGMLAPSCLVLAIECGHKEITTIEGLAHRETGELHPIQKAFVENHALQCGFCTPGMIVAAKALLDKDPDPTEAAIRDGINGNICRCTGYDTIVRAIAVAAETMRGGK
jgi:carbon-monoxide dehydrogenase small subunit